VGSATESEDYISAKSFKSRLNPSTYSPSSLSTSLFFMIFDPDTSAHLKPWLVRTLEPMCVPFVSCCPVSTHEFAYSRKDVTLNLEPWPITSWLCSSTMSLRVKCAKSCSRNWRNSWKKVRGAANVRFGLAADVSRGTVLHRHFIHGSQN
jgi:hypothetical protein